MEKTDTRNIDPEVIARAARIIREGGLVAFPTETVYGLGADALNPAAARRIYEAKGRPSDNPLIVHISDFEALFGIAAEIPAKARLLAERFWPGPLTMIFRKNDKVPLETTGGLSTVAVRMPDHPVALALIEASTGYIAAPSANTSGKPSPTRAEHVLLDMEGRIPMILDGGPVGIGIESTIVDFSEEVPTILRPGYITREMLSQVIGQVRVDPGLSGMAEADPGLNSPAGMNPGLSGLAEADPGLSSRMEAEGREHVRPKAPGMKYRHYAPKAPMILVKGRESDVVDKINSLVREAEKQGKKAGVIGTEETVQRYGEGIVKCIATRRREETIAQNLYEVLREFDALEVDVIYSESFSDAGIGQAIMNRMLKAAGHRVLEV